MKRMFVLMAVVLCTGVTAQLPESLDEVTPFHEGLAAIRQGDAWAFIDDLGNIIIDFRNDLHWTGKEMDSDNGILTITYPHFSNGRCMVKKVVDDIPMFGFINTKGELVVHHEFLNVRSFKDGYTTGVIFEKILRGQNEFKLNIYEYRFHEVIMDTDGNIVTFLKRRYNIQMKKSRYDLPKIHSKLMGPKLIAVKKEGNWELQRLQL